MPDKHEVGGSSPLGPTIFTKVENNGEKANTHFIWGCSSAGRAPALQAGGHGFESHHLHHEIWNTGKRTIEARNFRIRTEEVVNNSPVDC